MTLITEEILSPDFDFSSLSFTFDVTAGKKKQLFTLN